ncbi:MAG: hypothetical protein JWL72_4471 [Ilumatobacteraceae bacterium]|nr:hypothetical protein [Ilumatobacteraceae bacterium]
MRRPQLRTPLARAVVPVLAGIGFFAVLGLLLWGAAAYIAAHSGERSNSFAPTTFEVGRTVSIAETVTADGPLIFPDLLRASGRRSIVLDHVGEDPQRGWRIYLAYPADRDVTCKVEQVRHTRNYTDCTGRTITAEDLALPPAGVLPIVSADGTLTLDLLPDSATSSTTGSTPGTAGATTTS